MAFIRLWHLWMWSRFPNFRVIFRVLVDFVYLFSEASPVSCRAPRPSSKMGWPTCCAEMLQCKADGRRFLHAKYGNGHTNYWNVYPSKSLPPSHLSLELCDKSAARKQTTSGSLTALRCFIFLDNTCFCRQKRRPTTCLKCIRYYIALTNLTPRGKSLLRS